VAWIRRQPNRCTRAMIVSLAWSTRVGSGTEYRLGSESTRAPRPTSVARRMRLSGEGNPVIGECVPCYGVGRFAWARIAGMEEDVR
jgi:hypothetical protein